MGHRELEAALRREGEAKAREIWQEVEAEAGKLRLELEQQLKKEQQGLQRRIAIETEGLLDAARTTAQQQAQLRRLEAEQQLAKRLKTLAEGRLGEISRTGGTSLFKQLAVEIPEHPWQLVKVHSRDRRAAQELFPQAEVRPSEQIIGGLMVQDQQGKVMIINTLEKRLAHLWADLLPELMIELRKRVKTDETAA